MWIWRDKFSWNWIFVYFFSLCADNHSQFSLLMLKLNHLFQFNLLHLSNCDEEVEAHWVNFQFVIDSTFFLSSWIWKIPSFCSGLDSSSLFVILSCFIYHIIHMRLVCLPRATHSSSSQPSDLCLVELSRVSTSSNNIHTQPLHHGAHCTDENGELLLFETFYLFHIVSPSPFSWWNGLDSLSTRWETKMDGILISRSSEQQCVLSTSCEKHQNLWKKSISRQQHTKTELAEQEEKYFFRLMGVKKTFQPSRRAQGWRGRVKRKVEKIKVELKSVWGGKAMKRQKSFPF